MVPIISNFQTMHNPNYPDTTSPIVLKVYFDGANQFDFKFKAPIGSTLDIYDGDGTMTQVGGNDAVEVTHTTSYPSGKTRTFYFYVEGDYADITWINVLNQSMISGDASGWGVMVNLILIAIGGTFIVCRIDGWDTLTSLVQVTMKDLLTRRGDISIFANAPLLGSLNIQGTGIYGDLSTLYQLPFSGVLVDRSVGVTFDAIQSFTVTARFWAYDCKWTSTMVDNALISLANGGTTTSEIFIAGNNAARTSASDAAKATLEGAGCTVTVNE